MIRKSVWFVGVLGVVLVWLSVVWASPQARRKLLVVVFVEKVLVEKGVGVGIAETELKKAIEAQGRYKCTAISEEISVKLRQASDDKTVQQLLKGFQGSPQMLVRATLTQVKGETRLNAEWLFVTHGGVHRSTTKDSRSLKKLDETFAAWWAKEERDLERHLCQHHDTDACRWLCGQGEGGACESLGLLYYKGEEVSQDYAKAHSFFAKGCDLKNGGSCQNLGFLYHVGLGVSQDYAKAHSYFSKGCDLNSGLGCQNLGLLYQKGQGASQDYAKAHSSFSKGCDLKNGGSCTYLGLLYEKGHGVRKDCVRAKELYQKACKLDEQAACAYTCP